MFKTVIFISIISVTLCQYPQQRSPPRRSIPEYDADYDDYQPPRAQPAPPPPPRVSPNSVRLRPASVHYVNIGPELAGDYKFGYDTGKGDDGQSFREETRLPDGTVQGAYGYVDETGVQRIVKYIAGKDGFKVLKDSESSKPATRQSSPQQAPPQPARAAPYAPPPQPARAAPYVPPQQPARAAPYVPPQQPARAPAYAPPPQPARAPVQNYAPGPQPARQQRPVQTYAPQPEPSYRAEPAYRPEPIPPAPQRSRGGPPKRQYAPRKPLPEDEPDYDYPDNDIQERRLVVVDTSLFNYNIGTNHK